MRPLTPPVGLPALAQPGLTQPGLAHTDLVGEIARVLTDAVVQGRIAPGGRLVEAAVARELGISRAPVREAARLLENQGLLVARPRRGFFVRALSPDDIDEFYDLRLCIERHAAVLAARRLDAAAGAALRRQLAVLREVADGNDLGRQIDEDFRFHRLICEIAGNRRLLKLFDDLSSELRTVIALIGRLYADPHKLAETHEPILAAIEAGHPERIVAHMDHHIGVAWQQVGALVRAMPAATLGATP